MAQPVHLRAEHLQPIDSLGIGISAPRLSWSFTDTDTGHVQSSFDLQIQYQDQTTLTHHARVSQNRFIPWPFSPLTSRQRVLLRVRTSFTNDPATFTPWSAPLHLETALLNPSDWKSSSIIQPRAPATKNEALSQRPVIFFRTFCLRKVPLSARLYISAHGVYCAHLNGNRVGDHVLAPGWTSYTHRLIYQTYDITSLLEYGGEGASENDLKVEVGEGWFSGRLGFEGGRKKIYGEGVGIVALVVVDFEDGTREEVGTDGKWRWGFGTKLQAGLYDGVVEDLRQEEVVEDEVEVAMLKDNLCTPVGPPVRVMGELSVKTVFLSPSGRVLLDFGQNFVGWIRARMQGEPGREVTFRHAEVLEHGELGTRPLRNAKATDTVILAGKRVIWEPEFTLHGFRYVEVSGWPGELGTLMNDITGIIVHSDMKRTGHFECSNPALNQLHRNIVWSMRGNFVSIPTDCPQRDERLGWTGDINVFADTANYLYDTGGMLLSWLEDLKCEQEDAHGIVPLTIPNVVPGLEKDAHAIWGDAVVMVPWSLFMTHGDLQILERYFASMQSWLNAIPRKRNGLWEYTSDWKLGDWLDPLAPPEDPGNVTTDPGLVSDAFLIHVTDRIARIASLIGQDCTANNYEQQAQRLREAFMEEYITKAGRVVSDTQTAYVLAIQFSLLQTTEQYLHASARLEYLIRRQSHFCIATGFAGTPYMGTAMTRVGLTSLFYRMLLHRKCPSWLYPITQGATTVWERWDSMLPDGSVNSGSMTSFNHYALGAVANWMHATVLGLRAIDPGWKTFAVEPQPGGQLTWAKGEFASPQGTIRLMWYVQQKAKENQDHLHMTLIVPANSSARVRLPCAGEVEERGSGRHEWVVPWNSDPSWPPSALYPPFYDRDDELPVDEVLPLPPDTLI